MPLLTALADGHIDELSRQDEKHTFDGLWIPEVMLHKLDAVEFIFNLIDHVRQLLKHQPTLQIRMSRLQSKQVITSFATKVNDAHLVFLSIA